MDGSGVEIRTPILQGVDGYEVIRAAMATLKDAGAYVTASDGLHVHHDAPEFVAWPQKCEVLVRSWLANQQAIQQLVAPRRRGSGHCPPWNDAGLSILGEWIRGDRPYFYASRNDLNLNPLADQGTIEIRLHEGTLDADVAIAWIMFGQRFIHDVLQRTRPLPQTTSDENLLSRLRLSVHARAALIEKRRMNYRTPQTGWLS
jgi:hypothetical protein